VADEVDEVVGVDLSESMLDVARARLGGTGRAARRRPARPRPRPDLRGRHLAVQLHRVRQDLDELDATIAALARHVAPGGVLVVEPWIDPADWEDGRTQVVDVEEEGRRAVRVITSRREGDVSLLEVAVVSAAAGRLTVEREEHRMLLVPRERLLDSVRAAGLEPTWDDPASRTDGFPPGGAW
jgi:SAM-dependent methyltransferase